MTELLLAEKLKKLRNRAKLSQKEFAESLGMTQSALSKIERGIQMPRAENLIKIREVYRVNLNKLLV